MKNSRKPNIFFFLLIRLLEGQNHKFIKKNSLKISLPRSHLAKLARDTRVTMALESIHFRLVFFSIIFDFDCQEFSITLFFSAQAANDTFFMTSSLRNQLASEVFFSIFCCAPEARVSRNVSCYYFALCTLHFACVIR